MWYVQLKLAFVPRTVIILILLILLIFSYGFMSDIVEHSITQDFDSHQIESGIWGLFGTSSADSNV